MIIYKIIGYGLKKVKLSEEDFENFKLEQIKTCVMDYAKKKHIDYDVLEIAKSQNRKPYFKNINSIHFSVTNKEELCFIAMNHCLVGIDIEVSNRDFKANNKGNKRRERQYELYKKLAKRFYSEEELSYVENHGEKGFLKIWTAKESYIKLLGLRLLQGLKEISTVKDGELIECLPTSLTQHLHGDFTGESHESYYFGDLFENYKLDGYEIFSSYCSFEKLIIEEIVEL